ncbi:MAG: hydroxyethylthiazole kinase [Peptococcaceae bacterium]|jgi:hydroxyethylthiazole kinase|nr:hydroxyethylthiazole kinase [Peptococcaceae bacterium]
MSHFAAITKAVADARAANPLVGSWTNFVTINLVANTQLAVGGRAAMCFMPDEAIPLTSISKATYINIGTLEPVALEALPQAAEAAVHLQKPWVFDPVAAGLGDTRNAIIKALKKSKPSVIRGNASEIIAVSHLWELQSANKGNVDGVDATDSVEDALFSARELAKWTGGVVAVSGETDVVLDARQTFRISGGSAMLKTITGAGCSLGGVIAVYAGVTDPLTAALTGSLAYKWASEEAESSSTGSGSFQVAFIDRLSLLSGDALIAYARGVLKAN